MPLAIKRMCIRGVGVKPPPPKVVQVPQKVDSAFWLLYSVVIQLALRVLFETLASSIRPCQNKAATAVPPWCAPSLKVFVTPPVLPLEVLEDPRVPLIYPK